MRLLFKEPPGKFFSLISLIVICGLFVIFFLTLQQTLLTGSGRFFAVIWLLAAILLFIVHVRRLAGRRRNYRRYPTPTEKMPVNKSDRRRLLRG